MDARIMPWAVHIYHVCVWKPRAPDNILGRQMCVEYLSEGAIFIIIFIFIFAEKWNGNQKKNTTCSSKQAAERRWRAWDRCSDSVEAPCQTTSTRNNQWENFQMESSTLHYYYYHHRHSLRLCIVAIKLTHTHTSARLTAQHIIRVPLCFVPYTNTCSMESMKLIAYSISSYHLRIIVQSTTQRCTAQG